jgi:hypothetical protein
MRAPLPERWFLMAEYLGKVADDPNETSVRRDEARLLAPFFLAVAIDYNQEVTHITLGYSDRRQAMLCGKTQQDIGGFYVKTLTREDARRFAIEHGNTWVQAKTLCPACVAELTKEQKERGDD